MSSMYVRGTSSRTMDMTGSGVGRHVEVLVPYDKFSCKRINAGGYVLTHNPKDEVYSEGFNDTNQIMFVKDLEVYIELDGELYKWVSDE